MSRRGLVQLPIGRTTVSGWMDDRDAVSYSWSPLLTSTASVKNWEEFNTHPWCLFLWSWGSVDPVLRIIWSSLKIVDSGHQDPQIRVRTAPEPSCFPLTACGGAHTGFRRGDECCLTCQPPMRHTPPQKKVLGTTHLGTGAGSTSTPTPDLSRAYAVSKHWFTAQHHERSAHAAQSTGDHLAEHTRTPRPPNFHGTSSTQELCVESCARDSCAVRVNRNRKYR